MSRGIMMSQKHIIEEDSGFARLRQPRSYADV